MTTKEMWEEFLQELKDYHSETLPDYIKTVKKYNKSLSDGSTSEEDDDEGPGSNPPGPPPPPPIRP